MTRSTTAAGWVEQARLLPLRWGHYLPRLIVGTALIALGICSVQLTTAYSLQFLAWGAIAQGAGWVVLPMSGWRRLAAIFPAELAGCLLLAGGGYSSAFGIILWGWLLVRTRPKITYLLILVPLAYGGAFSGGTFPGSIMVEYAYAWLVFVGAGMLTIGCAWAARWWAVRSWRVRAERAQAEQAGRARHPRVHSDDPRGAQPDRQKNGGLSGGSVPESDRLK